MQLAPEEVAKADTAKLHAEVNYYVNHQYALYAAGLTIVGVVVAWVSQKADVNDLRTLDLAYLGCSSVLVFLVLLNFLDLRLEVARHICATYLRLSGRSEWEKEIESYALRSKSKRWLAITSRHGYYVLLGILAGLWPATLAVVVFSADRMSVLSAVHLGVCLAYGCFTIVLMPRILSSCRREIELTWATVLCRDEAADGTPTTIPPRREHDGPAPEFAPAFLTRDDD
jgi:hypothetical protein